MTLHRVILVAGALLCSLACQSEKSSTPTEGAPGPEAVAAASTTGPVLDNKIAEAVANAAEQGTEGKPSAGKEPPADGILGPQRADAEVPTGTPAKVVLGSLGGEPRVSLGGALPTQPRTGRTELSLRTGGSMLPTTELQLKVDLSKPTGDSPPALTFDVTSADLAATQSAQIPEEMAAELRKLKGSTFRYSRADTLTGTPDFELAKSANPELQTLMQASAAALAEALPALPSQPVGAGAFWMATSRETLLGTDVVAYRMVKVTEVKGEQAVLNVTTKRYLGGGGIGLPGIETAPVRQFQAESTTEITLQVGQRLPIDGRTQTSVRALVEREGQALPVQVEMRSLFAFPPPVTRPNVAGE